jgi:His-Xaa-Ser system protein HxsD
MTNKYSVEITVDATIYSKASIFRACYKFTDRAYIFLSRTENKPNYILVSITMKQPQDDPEKMIQEILELEFGPIRNLIVAQAFSEGNLLDD